MTKEELIAMALQAGMKDSLMYEHIKADAESLAVFAKLVAQHEREALCQAMEDQIGWDMYDPASTAIKVIRARTES